METKRPLKVVLVNSSDTTGGAAVVTYRLMNALRAEGIDARMLVFCKNTHDDNVAQVPHAMSFLKETGYIFLHNGFSRENLFKVSAGHAGTAVARHPWAREADVIALNWINQGLLSLDGVESLGQLGKPMVWTMHDMWPMTGACHHAYECTRYAASCGSCPYIRRGAVKTDMSRFGWIRKHDLYDDVDITFVPVSSWLADRCRESSLLRDRDIEVIPNAFPTGLFSTSTDMRPLWPGLDAGKRLILMGAARLDDPIKGLPYAIEALNLLEERRPDLAKTTQAVFFGKMRNPQALAELRFPHAHIGPVYDKELLHRLYASADAVISTSLYETLPGTLIEGQAAGCLPVTFGRGGQCDIVSHKINGYIADYRSAASVADGLEWALDNPTDREALHEQVRERFDASVIARRYIALFERLLAARKSNR
ncbi:MAG: glycosyltransferase [Pseudoflavonifractor sp.]|nr:glycosyltransferase [Pseudoflavonifractor sp.]